MEKYKKRNLVIWIITGCVALAILLTVCFKFVYIDQSIGDFWVRMYVDKCYILGTTTQGNNQRYLIIPEKIKGRKVEYIGTPRPIVGGINRANIGSTVVEKVFFEMSDIGVQVNTFDDCSQLKKIFALRGEINHVQTNLYYTYKYFMTHIKISDFNATYNNFHTKPANVSYNYNFNGAENDGYYWIDDYDYGSKIEFIPPEPKRKGYTFGGWYKEPECKNKWSFETDVLPEERTETNEEGEEEVIYQETSLYAKWI